MALTASLTNNEPERLAALRALGLADGPPADTLERVTRLVSQVLEAPIAMICLVEESRLHPLAHVGAEIGTLAREGSFCAHTIAAGQALVVEDALADPRFADNPWVAGPPRIRAYLGVPIHTLGGHPVATLCAMDTRARCFRAERIGQVQDFARIVEDWLHARERAILVEGLQQGLLERERLFRDTFELAAVGIAHTALNGQLMRVNPRLCQMLGYSAEELRALTFVDITHPDDVARNMALFRQATAGKIDGYRFDKRFRCKSGEYLWTDLAVSLRRSAAGAPQFMIAVIEDISEKKQTEAELTRMRDSLAAEVARQTSQLLERNEALRVQFKQTIESEQALREALQAIEIAHTRLMQESVTDYLTGLSNRRVFSEHSEAAARRFQATGTPYGLILLDLDDFKQINDDFGHDVGDEVLRAMGRILKAQLRDSQDVVARLGGEEFAVLCFGTLTETSLCQLAERIGEQIGKEGVHCPKGIVRFTSSLGVALSQVEDVGWRSIYARADSALYEAKASGKNRVVFGHSNLKSSTGRQRMLRDQT
jgi:diguanylate cyclase (GGDEF)-like protein/PAS domain S-box-containing protein